ncbi:aminotransferase class V-fold PLP-dependent enzyme [Orenia marismortui]|uniref:cysteine desulfurase n=1 Tax=Orenia marismortui TaxID=46469 RepID=A0A4V3GYJ2_9FIRM|nr:aminotransferase class V-fold PLP-dependent enzyme [Orenia marismortui]TDX53151.1 cysteine desulfurase family protein [Orenia marismortui]
MIYLNNAATTWPKPEQVYQEIDDFFRNYGTNPSRGGSLGLSIVERKIFEIREKLAALINAQHSARIIFTSGATESLNLGIKGIVKKGDHVITSCLEHNSVLRPLNKLKKDLGIEVSYIDVDEFGTLDPKSVAEAIREDTRLIITTHASNVIGTLVDIKEIAQLARKNNILYMVDAAQTAGVFPIDLEEVEIDLLAMPGHKSLYGPPGIGVLYIREGIELDTLIEGGTGSNSLDPYQPQVIPDRYESGTQNTIGIIGLGSGIDFINQTGLLEIKEHELELTDQLLKGLIAREEVVVYGRKDTISRAPVVAFNLKGQGAAEVAYRLEDKYSIAVRAGLHCAPLVHKSLGTVEQGMIRVSFSYFNTKKDVETLLKAIDEILKEIK